VSEPATGDICLLSRNKNRCEFSKASRNLRL